MPQPRTPTATAKLVDEQTLRLSRSAIHELADAALQTARGAGAEGAADFIVVAVPAGRGADVLASVATAARDALRG